MPEQDLANLARLLHHSRNLTAEQIRNRSGFLDNNYDPYIPLGTIQAWLSEGTKGTTERERISERAAAGEAPRLKETRERNPIAILKQMNTQLAALVTEARGLAAGEVIAAPDAPLAEGSIAGTTLVPVAGPDAPAWLTEGTKGTTERERIIDRAAAGEAPSLKDTRKRNMIAILQQMKTQLAALVTEARGIAAGGVVAAPDTPLAASNIAGTALVPIADHDAPLAANNIAAAGPAPVVIAAAPLAESGIATGRAGGPRRRPRRATRGPDAALVSPCHKPCQ